MSLPFHFRDKIKLLVGGTIEAPLLGFIPEGDKSITEIPNCPIQAEVFKQDIDAIKNFIKDILILILNTGKLIKFRIKSCIFILNCNNTSN